MTKKQKEALIAARDFLVQEHRDLGICKTRGCEYKIIIKKIKEALQ